jgi:phosphate/sulfate permease
MDHAIVIMALLVVVALLFDFMNGFHDAANSIALMVSTRLLTPQAAVVWAAFFNFIAFLFFGLHVADTVGKGIIDPTSSIMPSYLAHYVVPSLGMSSLGGSAFRHLHRTRLSAAY